MKKKWIIILHLLVCTLVFCEHALVFRSYPLMFDNDGDYDNDAHNEITWNNSVPMSGTYNVESKESVELSGFRYDEGHNDNGFGVLPPPFADGIGNTDGSTSLYYLRNASSGDEIEVRQTGATSTSSNGITTHEYKYDVAGELDISLRDGQVEVSLTGMTVSMISEYKPPDLLNNYGHWEVETSISVMAHLSFHGLTVPLDATHEHYDLSDPTKLIDLRTTDELESSVTTIVHPAEIGDTVDNAKVFEIVANKSHPTYNETPNQVSIKILSRINLYMPWIKIEATPNRDVIDMTGGGMVGETLRVESGDEVRLVVTGSKHSLIWVTAYDYDGGVIGNENELTLRRSLGGGNPFICTVKGWYDSDGLPTVKLFEDGDNIPVQLEESSNKSKNHTVGDLGEGYVFIGAEANRPVADSDLAGIYTGKIRVEARYEE